MSKCIALCLTTLIAAPFLHLFICRLHVSTPHPLLTHNQLCYVDVHCVLYFFGCISLFSSFVFLCFPLFFFSVLFFFLIFFSCFLFFFVWSGFFGFFAARLSLLVRSLFCLLSTWIQARSHGGRQFPPKFFLCPPKWFKMEKLINFANACFPSV